MLPPQPPTPGPLPPGSGTSRPGAGVGAGVAAGADAGVKAGAGVDAGMAAPPPAAASASGPPRAHGPEAGAQPPAGMPGPAAAPAPAAGSFSAPADPVTGLPAGDDPASIAGGGPGRALFHAPFAGHCATPSTPPGSDHPVPPGPAGGARIDINLDLDLGPSGSGPGQPASQADAASGSPSAFAQAGAQAQPGAPGPANPADPDRAAAQALPAASQASMPPAPPDSGQAAADGPGHGGSPAPGGLLLPPPRRRMGRAGTGCGTGAGARPGMAAATGADTGVAMPANAAPPQTGRDADAAAPPAAPAKTHAGPPAPADTAAGPDAPAPAPAASPASGRAASRGGRAMRRRRRTRRKPAPWPLRLLGALWRGLLWLVLALLALLLLCAATLWLFNWRDEPLRPDLQQALDFRPPDAQAMQRNGYFAMLGLTAPASENARAAGERFFAAQMQGLDSYRLHGLPAAPTEEAFAQQPLALGALSCAAATHDCLAHYQRQLPGVRAALARLAHVQQRYLALADAPAYEEVLPPYTLLPRPPYADLRAASELVLMQAAVHLHDGRASDALALLARNAALHQRLVQGARSRLGALSAIGMQLRQQRLISDMLRQQPELARTQAPAWQAALAADPLPLGPALQGQVNWTVGAAHADFSLSLPLSWNPGDPWPQQLKGRLLEPLYRLTWLPQATLNRLWLRERAAAALATQPAQRLDAQVYELLRTFPDSGTLDAPAGQGFAPRLDDLRRLHNYVGQALLSIWSPRALVDDIERAHDTEGHRRLVLLQLAALQQNLRPAALPGWLAASPPEWRNPYTLAPMEWDAATDSLLFTGRQTAQQNPDASRQWRLRMPSPGP